MACEDWTDWKPKRGGLEVQPNHRPQNMVFFEYG